MKKPVHYILWKTQPGGAESLVTAYIEHFSKTREQYLYSLRPSENELSSLPELHFQAGYEKNLDCYRAYFRYCRQHRDGVFHLVNAGPVVLLLTLLAGVRQPVYHIHGTKYWKSARERIYLKTAWLLCGLFPFRVVANSAHSAVVFRKRVLRKKLNIVYNGFDVDSFLAKRHRRTELRRLAYIGRFHTGKNVDLTIRLFNEIAGQQPQLELHLAGTGNLLGALEAQAAESPFRDRIKFHGWVQDMAAFYAGADLFIFPSAHESFGNVVLEALLTGLPVLASNIPAFDEIHGGDPAFSLGDPANYAEARERFLTGVAHFPELAEKAWALGGQLGPQFSMEKHLAGIGRMYD